MTVRLMVAIPAMVALTVLGGAPSPAAAQWSVRDLPSQTSDAAGVVATATAVSGDAQVQIGCSPDGLPFVSIEHLGYDSIADTLTVRYRVDGLNTIETPWPRQPAQGALLVYNANPLFVEEFASRVARGSRLSVSMEMLPPLRFSLRGSSAAINRMRTGCAQRAAPAEPPASDQDPSP